MVTDLVSRVCSIDSSIASSITEIKIDSGIIDGSSRKNPHSKAVVSDVKASDALIPTYNGFEEDISDLIPSQRSAIEYDEHVKDITQVAVELANELRGRSSKVYRKQKVYRQAFEGFLKYARDVLDCGIGNKWLRSVYGVDTVFGVLDFKNIPRAVDNYVRERGSDVLVKVNDLFIDYMVNLVHNMDIVHLNLDNSVQASLDSGISRKTDRSNVLKNPLMRYVLIGAAVENYIGKRYAFEPVELLVSPRSPNSDILDVFDSLLRQSKQPVQ